MTRAWTLHAPFSDCVGASETCRSSLFASQRSLRAYPFVRHGYGFRVFAFRGQLEAHETSQVAGRCALEAPAFGRMSRRGARVVAVKRSEQGMRRLARVSESADETIPSSRTARNRARTVLSVSGPSDQPERQLTATRCRAIQGFSCIRSVHDATSRQRLIIPDGRACVPPAKACNPSGHMASTVIVGDHDSLACLPVDPRAPHVLQTCAVDRPCAIWRRTRRRLSR